MKLIVLFIVLNVVNVIIQTAKSIVTIKCGKVVASLVNAIAYGLYTIVVIYTVCELPLWFKVLVVALSNLIGVYVVKLIEEKKRKDRLWKIEVTIPMAQKDEMIRISKIYELNFNYIEINKYTIFNFYCSTQEESKKVKKILETFNAKYFINESKGIL